MPTYEFRCKLGHTFEDMQPSDAPNPLCHIDQCANAESPTVKVPSFRGHVQGDTPKFYPNRG